MHSLQFTEAEVIAKGVLSHWIITLLSPVGSHSWVYCKLTLKQSIMQPQVDQSQKSCIPCAVHCTSVSLVVYVQADLYWVITLTNYRNHAVPVQFTVAATRIRQLTWQFTMPNWCPNWVSMPTTWASRLNSKLPTTPVQRISWSKFKTQSFQPHLPWRVSSALSPIALLFPMMLQTQRHLWSPSPSLVIMLSGIY